MCHLLLLWCWNMKSAAVCLSIVNNLTKLECFSGVVIEIAKLELVHNYSLKLNCKKEKKKT